MPVYHTSWAIDNDLTYEIGPFYFCSEKCREEWKGKMLGHKNTYGKCDSFRDDIEELEADLKGCDNCCSIR